MHRDVKLENWRFRGDPEASSLVLLDFGLCCGAPRESPLAIVGTLPYIAPEMAVRVYDAKVR